jgi:hypothetical protein
MPNGEDSLIHTIHTIWSAILSGMFAILAGIVGMFGRRLLGELDRKADKDDVDQLRNDFQASMESQERMHRENRLRLDRILENTAVKRK